jgi:OOP family OmpA-OmpF porin
MKRVARRAAFGVVGLIAIATSVALAPRDAHAESGRFNLHLDVGPFVPILGELGPEHSNVLPVGGVGWVSFDWQLAPPVALEAIAGGGALGAAFPGRPGSVTPLVEAALGARLRFLDNHEGYANEQGGDFLGNFWVSAHAGYFLFDNSQFGVDAAVGYEWSVFRPFQAGVFLRGAFLFDFGAGREHDALLTAGINVSLELGHTDALDSDHDGLSDERESARWHTSAFNPDSDGDGLGDGLEVRTNTDPTRPDTDGDGLLDGAEDANHNGAVDTHESDPRVADTDHGGVNDGWEAQHPPHDVRDPHDDDTDGDRVADDRDACPNTPHGTEVDERGCAVLRAQLVLDGINFEFNSAQILPTSEPTLLRAVQILRDNAGVRVEIGGHTDNQGTPTYNLRLSQQRAASVRDWLVAHEIEPARMTVRGYGQTHPRASNDTPEGQAQNRRIEFRRLDASH